MDLHFRNLFFLSTLILRIQMQNASNSQLLQYQGPMVLFFVLVTSPCSLNRGTTFLRIWRLGGSQII